VVICSPQQVNKLNAALPEAKVIGKVVKAKEGKKVIID
jgi:hypothetical protein